MFVKQSTYSTQVITSAYHHPSHCFSQEKPIAPEPCSTIPGCEAYISLVH